MRSNKKLNCDRSDHKSYFFFKYREKLSWHKPDDIHLSFWSLDWCETAAWMWEEGRESDEPFLKHGTVLNGLLPDCVMWKQNKAKII